jgi:phospholipase/carboxylesterase
MKRTPLESAQAAAVRAPQYLDHGLLRSEQCENLRYALFAPMHYEQNYAYPTVIWLHGPGQDERQLQRIMPLVSMRNYVSVAPRGPRAAENGIGHTWSDHDADIQAATQSVFDCLDLVVDKYNVAPRRIFLAGHMTGGTMAFRIGLRSPHRFAGVLSLGGPFPSGNSPLVHFNQARQLPLFIAQGRDSQQYPVERTCDELRLFHAAGMHVTLRQYPWGDELNPQMLHDMNVWMMEQVTGERSEIESSSAQASDEY